MPEGSMMVAGTGVDASKYEGGRALTRENDGRKRRKRRHERVRGDLLELMAEHLGAKKGLRLRVRVRKAAKQPKYEEQKHRRQPKGHPKGGQFTNKPKAKAKSAKPKLPVSWSEGRYSVERVGDTLYVTTPYDDTIRRYLKGKGGNWDRDEKRWELPAKHHANVLKYIQGKAAAELQAQEQAAAAERETRKQAFAAAKPWESGPFKIDVDPQHCSLESPKEWDLIYEVKRIPSARWDAISGTWVCDISDYDKLREVAEKYAERHRRAHTQPEHAKPWEQGRYRVALYKGGFVGLTSPYNHDLVGEIKSIKGAQWSSSDRRWYWPVGMYDKVLALAQKWARKEATDAATEEDRPSEARKPTAPKTEWDKAASEPGVTYVSRGEGYGGREFRKGDLLRTAWEVGADPVPCIVVAGRKKYYREDGMSFGVGDESGYLFEALVRRATEEEAKPLLEYEARKAHLEEMRALRTTLAARITGGGEYPPPWQDAEGQVYSDTFNIYGSGDRFVISDKWIWYLQNNGMDGDCWAHNNVETGGAGAIGWRVPYDAQLADQIRSLPDEIAQEMIKAITEGGKYLERLANREPICVDDSKEEVKSRNLLDIIQKPGGRGRMGRQALGPGGDCVCPECGYSTAHNRAEPCDEKRCPKCGTALARETENTTKAANGMTLLEIIEKARVKGHYRMVGGARVWVKPYETRRQKKTDEPSEKPAPKPPTKPGMEGIEGMEGLRVLRTSPSTGMPTEVDTSSLSFEQIVEHAKALWRRVRTMGEQTALKRNLQKYVREGKFDPVESSTMQSIVSGLINSYAPSPYDPPHLLRPSKKKVLPSSLVWRSLPEETRREIARMILQKLVADEEFAEWEDEEAIGKSLGNDLLDIIHKAQRGARTGRGRGKLNVQPDTRFQQYESEPEEQEIDAGALADWIGRKKARKSKPKGNACPPKQRRRRKSLCDYL